MIICLERGADLHMTQRISLPLTVSSFGKIQIGFTFLVPAHPGCPGQRVVKPVCVWGGALNSTPSNQPTKPEIVPKCGLVFKLYHCQTQQQHKRLLTSLVKLVLSLEMCPDRV